MTIVASRSRHLTACINSTAAKSKDTEQVKLGERTLKTTRNSPGWWGNREPENPSSAQRRREEKGKRYCARFEDYLVFISLILQLNVSRRLAPGLRITIAQLRISCLVPESKRHCSSPQNTFLTTFSNRRAASSRNASYLVERRHSVTILTAMFSDFAFALCCCCARAAAAMLLPSAEPRPPPDCRSMPHLVTACPRRFWSVMVGDALVVHLARVALVATHF